MAGSSLDANVVFPPYENSKDVLSGWSIEYHRDHYKDVSIEQIAPSAAKANSSERQGMVAAHGQSENEREQTGDETKNLSKLH
jgi:hypothetical protein